MINESKFKGCFKGLAIADSLGALHEGGPIERLLWRFIGKTSKGRRRFTDDTQMSIDIANSFLANKDINQDHLAQTFAASYRWSRGYGPSAGKLLKGIKAGQRWQDLNRRKFKDGSIGNGAAMRAPIVALCHPSIDVVLKEFIVKTAEITHAHPIAIEGAYLIALTTCMALADATNDEILATLSSSCEDSVYKSKLTSCVKLLADRESIDRKQIKAQLGNGILATESSMTAIFFALAYRDRELMAMLKQIFQLGGDTDTIGAMAGAIWGAFNGDLEMNPLAQDIEDIEIIDNLAYRLHQLYKY